uniref:Putative lectin/glucanase superfamily protein n=1 Tax=viral metagenome TaxID=1070528 RepID=A0A6M3IFV5_9ZZZZ
MRKPPLYILIASMVLFLGLQYTPGTAQQQQLPTHQFKWVDLNGQWMPDLDASEIGVKNYKVLQNLRYTDTGIEGVSGSSPVNPAAIHATYMDIQNGYHFLKDDGESHVIVQAYESNGLLGSAFRNSGTTIPGQFGFSGKTLYQGETGAGPLRMAQGPEGYLVACDEKRTMVWPGESMPVAAFFLSDEPITSGISNIQDYTEAVNNKLSGPNDVAVMGGGNDQYTKLLLHFDGPNGSQTSWLDSSASAHTVTGNTNAQLDTSQSVFGLSSVTFDGVSSLEINDSDDWYFNEAFTIDCWVRFGPNVENKGRIFEQKLDDDNLHMLRWVSGGRLVWSIYNGGVELFTKYTVDGLQFQTDNWYHIALVNKGGSGNSEYTIYVDGKRSGTIEDEAVPFPNIVGHFYIGNNTDDNRALVDTHIDEFRVTKGRARWTSDFAKPARPYQVPYRYAVIGTVCPIAGVSTYLKNVNPDAGATKTWTAWNGESWSGITTDNLTYDSGNTFTQDGFSQWTGTTDWMKPKYLNNRYLYWTQLEFWGEMTIEHLTAYPGDEFLPLNDIWNGLPRQPIGFHVYWAAKDEYFDYTGEVNETALMTSVIGYPYVAQIGGLTNQDEIIVIFEDRTTAIGLDIISGNTEDISATGITIFYGNGTGWANVGDVADTTGATQFLSTTGVLSWTAPDPEEEFSQTLFGKEGFAYKIQVSTRIGWGRLDAVTIDLVEGIPAQKVIKPYKFPAKFKDMLLLCGYPEGNEGNRIDYSAPNSSFFHNGDDSSDDALYSIRVPVAEELTGFVEIFNRYGAGVYTLGVILSPTTTSILTGSRKEDFKILPISDSIGCASWRTIFRTVGYELTEDGVGRNMAGWLDWAGPVLFDGSIITRMKGIGSYFQPNHTNYLGAENIKNAFGWYDANYREYNLRVSTYWLVYDLTRKRWYEKYAPSMPRSAWPVTDRFGTQHIFSGTTTGYMMQLDDTATTWDGTGIEYVWETGDFSVVEDPWRKGRVYKIKMATVRIDEDAALTVQMYADTESTIFPWQSMDLDRGTARVIRQNLAYTGGVPGWLLRLRGSTTLSSTKRFKPLGFGLQYGFEAIDD